MSSNVETSTLEASILEASGIEGIIFDFGGVMATFFRPDLFRTLESRLGLELGSLSEILWRSDAWRLAERGAIDDEEYWRRIAPRLNLHTPEETRRLQLEIYAGVEADPRIVDLVRRLHRRYRIGLLSNTSATDPEQLLGHFRLDGLFDAVVLSAAEGLVKPDPAIYRLALRRLGTAPQATIFVDDYPPNIEAAATLGIRAIHFAGYPDLVSELQRQGVQGF
jgi:epoxide hydrolase-like predicted phosphatase